jgi:signal transduction histidine kinase
VAVADPERAQRVLQTIAGTGREALRDMRSLLGALRHDDTGSAADTPQPTIQDITDLIDRLRDSGLPVLLEQTGDPLPLSRAAHLAGYRLVQEALTNVVKHAGPQAAAWVRIDWGDADLRITVRDDGQPPPPTVGTAGPGRGQIGMAERLALVGGTLDNGPLTDGGYQVVGRIPALHGDPVTPRPQRRTG